MGNPETRDTFPKIKRAVRITEKLNRMDLEDPEAIRATWSELTGQPVDDAFMLIPPLLAQHGLNTRVGRNPFRV